jgi:ureidoglycolate dehydrogenase (NAD+)
VRREWDCSYLYFEGFELDPVLAAGYMSIFAWDNYAGGIFMAGEFYHVEPEDLKVYCKEIFMGHGLSEEDAKVVTASLVEADLRNVISHGVVRVGNYVDRLKQGGAKAKPQITVVSETPTTMLLDGDDCLGSVVSEKAVHMVREKAAVHGMAYAAVRKSNHFGAAAYWSMKLAGNDMIGFSGSNVEPIVCVTGGKSKGIGNNPFSYAFPTKRHGFLCFDAACSTMAGGKKFEYQRLKKQLPEGCFCDENGKPTTDPFKAEILLPFGGYKGYGLAVVVEMLSSILAGGKFGSQMGSQYGKLDSSNHSAHYFMAIKIEAFRPLSDFFESTDGLVDYLHGLPKADGVEYIYVPGEIENASKVQKERDGLEIHVDVLDSLIDLGKEVGLGETRSAFLKIKPVK